MFFAFDQVDGHQVAAQKGLKNVLCGCCKEQVLAKCGEIKIWHFAHEKKSQCEVALYGGMTKWHLEWQERFPEKCREITREYFGIRHRADVICNNTVFECQKKMMPLEVMLERENFWRKAGYTFYWIFESQKVDSYGEPWFQILKTYNGDARSFKWRHAPEIAANISGNILIDIGNENFFSIKKFHRSSRPYAGWGNVKPISSIQDWIQKSYVPSLVENL